MSTKRFAKIYLLPFISAVIILSSCSSKESQIKTVESYYYANGYPLYVTEEYEPDGSRIAYYEKYDNNGNPIASYEITYDADDHILTKVYHTDGNSEILPNYNKRYQYNKAGDLVGTYTYEPGELMYYKYKTKYTYDIFRNKTILYTFDKKGDLISQKELDKNGNTIAVHFYDNSGLTFYYKYDKNNNLIFDSTWEKDGTPSEIIKKTYDEHGNETYYFSISYPFPPSSSIYEYEYDDNGNIITMHAYTDNQLDYYSEYEYDSHGSLICEKDYYASGELFWNQKYSYEYDENGNILVTYDYSYNFDNGTYKLSSKSECNTMGIWTATYFYDENNMIRSKIDCTEYSEFHIFEYDRNGNVTLQYDYGSPLYIYEYEYNEDGTVAVMHRSLAEYDDTLTLSYQYEKNENDNTYIQYAYKQNGSLVSTTYYENESDSDGRLTAQYAYDEENTLISSRKFTYYD